MTHFYLTLPSNSSMEYFPDNTLTDFTTKLTSFIELPNEWEVGLAEIMFPRSWYTIPKKGIFFEIDYARCDLRPLSEENEPTVKVIVSGGFYHTMEELVHELNVATHRAFSLSRLLTDAKIEMPTFYYKANAKKAHVAVTTGLSIKFPPLLENILGFSPTQNPLCNEGTGRVLFKGELACDLHAGIHALYVYCDLLQFTHVGDIKAPLLRVVNSGGEIGDVVTRYYERPRYVPLQRKNFDCIQILIRDDLGEKIRFENGKVLLVLHFRRTRNQYLI